MTILVKYKVKRVLDLFDYSGIFVHMCIWMQMMMKGVDSVAALYFTWLGIYVYR